MISYKKDEFLLMKNDELWKFYKNSKNDICYRILKEEDLDEEVILINDCYKLLSVILSNNGLIYILAISSSRALIFYTYSDIGIKENTLLNYSFDLDYIQIISLNNSLNLIYTRYDNNAYCLYHRIIDSNLFITAPVLIDRIQKDVDFPFIATVNNTDLIVLYIKKSQDYYIGYRAFSPSRYAWGSFITLDKTPLLPYDYSFIIGENNLFALSYSIKDSSNSFLRYGIIIDNIFKGRTLKTKELVDNYSYLVYEKDHFYLTYTFKNKLFLNLLSVGGDLISLEKIPYSKEARLEKYTIESDLEGISFTSGFILYENYKLAFSILSLINKFIDRSSPENTSAKKVDTTLYYEKQLIEKERQINKLNDNIKNLQTNVSQLERNKATLDTKENELKLLKEDLIKKNNTILEEYETKLRDKERIIENLNNSISELKNKLKTNHNIIDSLTVNNKELFDRITILQENTDSISKLKLQLLDKESIISKLRSEIQAIKNELESISSKSSKGSLLKKFFE